MWVCANCGNYFDDGIERNGIDFCSRSCADAFEAKTQPQTITVSGPDYSRKISNMQSELNALRQEQAAREQAEAQRRQQEKEERERKEQEEKERKEHLGLCAWCGRQNEQVYTNQILFPGRKFCSKKCLVDAKNEENPSASDAPHITAQGTGNVYTSIEDAFEWSKSGDTLMFSKGVFEIPGFFDDKGGVNLKAENNDMNLPLSERTVFKLRKGGLYLFGEGTSFIDGIVFEGLDKQNLGVTNYLNELVVKNCVFMNLYGGANDLGDDSIYENCLFINCEYGISSMAGYDSIPKIKFTNCTFDSVKYALSYGGPKAQLYDSVLKNSLPNPYVDVPSDNAQCCIMRTNKMYPYLQAAIDDSLDGDTIVLAPGKHHGGFVVGNKSKLTIKGAVTNLSAAETQLSTLVDVRTTAVWHSKDIKFEGIVFNASQILDCFDYEGDNDNKHFTHNVQFKGCRFTGLKYKIEEYAAFENCEIDLGDTSEWSPEEFEKYLRWAEKDRKAAPECGYYAVGNCCVYIYVSENCLTDDGKPAIPFGIETVGSVFSKVVEAGSSGTSSSVVFFTAVDNQTCVTMKPFAAPSNETTDIGDCAELGSYDFEGIKPMPKGGAQIEVHFEVFSNHWFKLYVTEKDGNVTVTDMKISNALKLGKIVSPKKDSFKYFDIKKKAKKSGFCTKCGAALVAGKKFCTKCGAKL